MPIADVAESRDTVSPSKSTDKEASVTRESNGMQETAEQRQRSAKSGATGRSPECGGVRARVDRQLSSKSVALIRSIAVGVVSLAIGLSLWQAATATNFNWFINFENVPSPLTVGAALIGHLGDAEFYVHISVSLKRILCAYSIAVVLGIAIGLLVGRSKTARAAVLPYVEIIRPIPAVAWIPLAILMWPTEESSIIYITFLGALFPIILNTVQGVEQTPEVLIRAARSLGAARLQVFWHVVLPSALPSISTGLAVGMGVSWFSLLAGEIISGQYGIGYFTWNAYSLIKYPDIVVGMLIIGCLGSLSTYLVRLVMRPALRWNENQ